MTVRPDGPSALTPQLMGGTGEGTGYIGFAALYQKYRKRGVAMRTR